MFYQYEYQWILVSEMSVCVSKHCWDKQIFCKGVGVYFILHDLSSTVSNLLHSHLYQCICIFLHKLCFLFVFLLFLF